MQRRPNHRTRGALALVTVHRTDEKRLVGAVEVGADVLEALAVVRRQPDVNWGNVRRSALSVPLARTHAKNDKHNRLRHAPPTPRTGAVRAPDARTTHTGSETTPETQPHVGLRCPTAQATHVPGLCPSPCTLLPSSGRACFGTWPGLPTLRQSSRIHGILILAGARAREHSITMKITLRISASRRGAVTSILSTMSSPRQ